MRGKIKLIAILVSVLTLFAVAVAVACGDTLPLLPDIDATVEARVELAKATPSQDEGPSSSRWSTRRTGARSGPLGGPPQFAEAPVTCWDSETAVSS